MMQKPSEFPKEFRRFSLCQNTADIAVLPQGKGYCAAVVGKGVGVIGFALCQQIGEGEGGAGAVRNKNDGINALPGQGFDAAESAGEDGVIRFCSDGQRAAFPGWSCRPWPCRPFPLPGRGRQAERLPMQFFLPALSACCPDGGWCRLLCNGRTGRFWCRLFRRWHLCWEHNW